MLLTFPSLRFRPYFFLASMNQESIRLQKFLADAGVCSRREGEDLIQNGKVKVNGKTVKQLGVKVTPGKDTVSIGKKIIESSSHPCILFHKPRSFTCNPDPRRPGRSIMEEFPDLKGYKVSVGLEKDASGLILLTTDGSLHQKVTARLKSLDRRYKLQLTRELEPKEIERLETGIVLDDIRRPLKKVRPVKVTRGEHWYEVTVSDTRDRLLHRIFETLPCPVKRQVQVGLGTLQDPKLSKGKARPVGAKELNDFLASIEVDTK